MGRFSDVVRKHGDQKRSISIIYACSPFLSSVKHSYTKGSFPLVSVFLECIAEELLAYAVETVTLVSDPFFDSSSIQVPGPPFPIPSSKNEKGGPRDLDRTWIEKWARH